MRVYCLKPSQSYLDFRQQVTLCEPQASEEGSLPYVSPRNEVNKALAASTCLRIQSRPMAYLFYEFGKEAIGYQGLNEILRVKDQLQTVATSINNNAFNEETLDRFIFDVSKKWNFSIEKIVKDKECRGFDPRIKTLYIDQSLDKEKDKVYSALVGLEAARLDKKLACCSVQTPTIFPKAIEYYSELPEGLAKNIAGHADDTAVLATEFLNGPDLLPTGFNSEAIRSITNHEKAVFVQKLAQSHLFSAFAFGVGPLMGLGFTYFNAEKFGAVYEDAHESSLMKLAYGATMVGSGVGTVASFAEFLRFIPLGGVSGLVGSVTAVVQAGIEYQETKERFEYSLASEQEMESATCVLSSALFCSGICVLTAATGPWSMLAFIMSLLPVLKELWNNFNTALPK